VLIDELRQILRDFAGTTGASWVSIDHEHIDDLAMSSPAPHPSLAAVGDEASQELTVAIGGGSILRARFEHGADDRSESRDAALERTARALRACARRWEAATLPPLSVPEQAGTSKERVLDRIHNYLHALAASQAMVNAALVYRGDLIACAEPLTELERERIPFTVKRVSAAASRRRGFSHANAAGDDFFAQSFYIDACLIAFFNAPYSPDFVRYRVRLVTRELAHLLPLLDDPPQDPAMVAPIPESS
jgi:hypothetical protein